MQPEGRFFAELGRLAGSQQENQLSRTLAACFNESPTFRRVLLARLWQTLGCGQNPPSPSSWRCSPEVRTPKLGGGRGDLYFSKPSSPHSAAQEIYAESKVDAPLTNRQIKKYLWHGVRRLVVVTKSEPEERVSSADVHYLRWQDVHCALRQATSTGGVGRQVCRWMSEYLEELDMAYREDLSLADVESCGNIFRVARSDKGWKQVALGPVFEIAHACASMLDDLHREFLDAHPKLREAPYKNGRTHYGKSIDDDPLDVEHFLGWYINRGHWAKWQFYCSICWPDDPDEDACFWVLLKGKAVKEHHSYPSLKKFLSKGVLDRAKLYAHLEARAREWGVV